MPPKKQLKGRSASPGPVKKAKVSAVKAKPVPPPKAQKKEKVSKQAAAAASKKAAVPKAAQPPSRKVTATLPPPKPSKPTSKQVQAASPPTKSPTKRQAKAAAPVPTPAKTVPKPAAPAAPVPSSDSKMVTQLKKGRAAVDLECPQAKTCHVFDDKVKVWTATLNQTSLQKNANKYYIIQLLQSDTEANKYWVWNRWGRVGYAGQCALKGPWGDLNRAKGDFEAKLRDKTRGGYVELDIVYDEEETKTETKPQPKAGKGAKNTPAKPPASSLDRRVQDLIRLIFDLNMINKTLAEIGYDAKKMPLGKLSQGNLRRGFEVLKRIEDALDSRNQGQLSTLTSEFYSLIPHDFGFQHMSQFIINTKQRLKEKVDMLESLAEMKIATNLIAEGTEEDPVQGNYDKLHCKLVPVERGTTLFSLLEDYVQTTHAATHNYYTLTVLDIFEVDREHEAERFKKNIKNRMLLWHGSRLTNWVGILSQGLRIAPPEAPVSGYMFGKGVYFADMVSKSANYCCTSRENNVCCMLLCDVAIGTPNELVHADFNASNLPAGTHSTKGVGTTEPDPSTHKTLDGMTVPSGRGVPANKHGYLLYNEYIVYDVAQIKMKYLFKMRFNYR